MRVELDSRVVAEIIQNIVLSPTQWVGTTHTLEHIDGRLSLWMGNEEQNLRVTIKLTSGDEVQYSLNRKDLKCLWRLARPIYEKAVITRDQEGVDTIRLALAQIVDAFVVPTVEIPESL